MEKYGLLEEHEMDSIIADSNEKTVASDVASVSYTHLRAHET
mgnify:CR=1 FL=1